MIRKIVWHSFLRKSLPPPLGMPTLILEATLSLCPCVFRRLFFLSLNTAYSCTYNIAAVISYNIPFPGLSAGLKGCEVEACLIFYACHILEATVRQHWIPWDLRKRWLFQCPSDCFNAWMWITLGLVLLPVPPLLPRDQMTVVQLHKISFLERNKKEITGKSSQRIFLRPQSGGNKHHNFRSWWMQINRGLADKLMTYQNQIAWNLRQ